MLNIISNTLRALACTVAILDLHVYSYVHFLYIIKPDRFHVVTFEK